MDFDFIKVFVSALVFGFLFFIIVNHVINMWFSDELQREGFETDTPSSNPSIPSTSTSIPSSNPSIPSSTSIPSSSPAASPDYATENSENVADLFDKVNTQIDMIRTLKEPYTDAIKTVSYNRDLSGNMLIITNLKTLINVAIAANDKDLQTNPGITKMFQYGGNDSIGEIIADLASLDEAKLVELCKKKNYSMCEKIDSATDRASCVLKIRKQCQREIEASYLARITTIVDGHQRIIDRILKKQSRD